MILYHGTTRSSASQIRQHGFVPRRPSRRVWFASSRNYAKHRAHTKAKRANDRPVVLRCNLNLNALGLGGGRIVNQNGIVAIRGQVPASVLCEDSRLLGQLPPHLDIPHSAAGLAGWLNGILGLRPHKGIGRRHPGLQRLLTWLRNRADANPRGVITEQELLGVAQQWLPEFFEDVEVDFEHLRALPAHGKAARRARLSELEPGTEEEEDDEAVGEQEEEILDCLMSAKPRRRVRGLKLLADLGGADLFEWTMMFLGDEDLSVQVAALEAMRASPDVNPALIADLATDDDRRIRAAALEVLAVHEADVEEDPGRRKWLWAGVTDPDTHVRLSMVKHLRELDPGEHRDIFETLLYDPNPEIARAARRLTVGKGFGKAAW